METVRITNFGTGGLNTDQIESGLKPGEWTRMEEMDIRATFLSSGSGYLMMDPDQCPIDPHYIHIHEQQTTAFILVSDGIEVYIWDGATYHTLATGWAGGRVTYTTFLGTLIINSASDGPFYWDGGLGSALQPCPGWPANYLCERMIAFGNFLVAIAQYRPTDDYEYYRVAWSDTAGINFIPNEWVPTAENLAGSRVLSDTSGHLVTGALLRDGLILYKGDSAYRMTPRNDNLVFDIRRIKARIGCDVYDGVAEYGAEHLVLTRGDLVRFDGQTATSIAVGRVRERLFDVLTKSEWRLSRVITILPRSEVWIVLKTAGSPDYNVLLKYDLEFNSFSTNRIKDVCGIAVGAPDPEAFEKQWNSPRTEDEWDTGLEVAWNFSQYNPSKDNVVFGSRIWVPGATPDDADVVDHREIWRTVDGLFTDQYDNQQYSIIEKTGIVVGGLDKLMLVKRIFPEMRGNMTVQITLGVENEVGGDITWGKPRQFRAGRDRFVNVRNIGQPIAIRIESPISAEDIYGNQTPLAAQYWNISAITFELQPAGLGR